jgi:hypothetical protein
MIATDWYAQSVLFQVYAIPDNDRGPRYAEAVLNSLHETNRKRQWVGLELDSPQGTAGLFVRVPVGLVATFTHDLADAAPRCQFLRVSGEAKPGTFVVSREITPRRSIP